MNYGQWVSGKRPLPAGYRLPALGSRFPSPGSRLPAHGSRRPVHSSLATIYQLLSAVAAAAAAASLHSDLLGCHDYCPLLENDVVFGLGPHSLTSKTNLPLLRNRITPQGLTHSSLDPISNILYF